MSGRSLRTRVRLLPSRAYGRAMDMGLVPYRRIRARDPEIWNSEYATGYLEYYAGLAELSRSSLLLGYLTSLGGSPEVLDIGCGVGIFRQRMEHLKFARYVGIDVSDVAIARAQELEDERTTFAVGELPPAELGPFDVVVMSEVLYYFADPAQTLDGVHSLLRPGGTFLTSISDHRGDGALHKLIEKRFECLDSVFAKSNQKNHGWRVSMYRARPSGGAPTGAPGPG